MPNIKVAVRVRPLIARETKNGEKPIWKTQQNTIYMESGKINTLHTYDHVFDDTSTNLQVYQQYCHPIVESVMLGFNGTIFAFGQTASGKTHTMMGSSKEPGLIPLTIDAIFDIIQNVPEREYLVRISYIEIYNENVLDLLHKDYAKKKPLQIRDNFDGHAVICDLTEIAVSCKEEIMSLVNDGECRRHVGCTAANPQSSRSHVIFRLVIESSLRDGTHGAVSVSQLNLVDLAGSESSEQCGDSVGRRFQESSRINVSLSFLAQVISKLSRGERGHINFRDSKLTRILRNSLGGNSHTAIVCTINPCSMEQTLGTLKFASSAKNVQNTPTVNEILTNETLIRRYHIQIQELKDQVKAMEETQLTKELEEKNSQIVQLKSKVSSLQKKLLVSTIPQIRKQRRETWPAPRSIGSLPRPLVRPEPQWAPPPPCSIEENPELGRGRLSTVVERSESFKAISPDEFEKKLQREERIRRSATLQTGDFSNTCNSPACAERISHLENELKNLQKENKKLQERISTLERLVGRPSGRTGLDLTHRRHKLKQLPTPGFIVQKDKARVQPASVAAPGAAESEKPAVPGAPATGEKPVATGAPAVPGAPAPAIPTKPAPPGAPATPTRPAAPGATSTRAAAGAIPKRPAALGATLKRPAAPGVPATPTKPPTTATPAPMEGPLNVKVPVVFVFGGPASGKGTQCDKIVAKYDFTYISSGHLLRAEVASGSDLGKQINDIMKQGELEPLDMIIQLIKEIIKKDLLTAKGFLLDGYPRNVEQGERFESDVCKCTNLIYFEVSDDTMKARLLKQGQTSGRMDDNEDTIVKRIKTFHDESEPVLQKYKSIVHKISAEDDPDKVFASVTAVMDNIIKPE